MNKLFKTLILFILLTGPVFAQENAESPLLFPLSCTLGEDCWTVNYVDIDPLQSGAKDFNCGAKTYDDHKGTDFGLKNYAVMESGVDVLAAAPGKILRVRMNEPDGEKTSEELEKIRAAKKECGNAILIDHGDNLQTLYCHLKQGSITVKLGDTVTAGQKIAQAGQSGTATFPHLHFGVVKDNEVIDPFTSHVPDSTCGTETKSLWSLGLPMNYEPLSLFDAQFTNGKPDIAAMKKKDTQPEFIPFMTNAFSFWAGIYGAQKGDQVTLTITAPDGSEFARSDYTQDKPAERQYVYTGREELVGLASGTYKAKAILKRGDDTQTIERTIDVR